MGKNIEIGDSGGFRCLLWTGSVWKSIKIDEDEDIRCFLRGGGVKKGIKIWRK